MAPVLPGSVCWSPASVSSQDAPRAAGPGQRPGTVSTSITDKHTQHYITLTLMIYAFLFLHRGVFFFPLLCLGTFTCTSSFGTSSLFVYLNHFHFGYVAFPKKKQKKTPKFIFKGKPFLLDLGQMSGFCFMFSWLLCVGMPGFAVALGLCRLTQIHLSTCVSSSPSCHAGVYFLGLVFGPAASLCVRVCYILHLCTIVSGLVFFFLFPVCGSSSCSLRFNHLIRVVKHTRDSSEQIRSFTSSDPVKLA